MQLTYFQNLLLERLDAMDARLRLLEDIVVPHDSIPWTVIAAAVALAAPGSRIVSVQPSHSVATDAVLQNLWSFDGRMRIFESHRLR